MPGAPPLLRSDDGRPARRGLAAVAAIVVLLIVDLIIVGLVLGGSRAHDLSIRRVETVQAFYAAEAGMHMAFRELLVDADEDGDCRVGSISHDGDAGNDPGFGAASFSVASSTSGSQTTLNSYGRAGSASRQMVAVVDVSSASASFSDDFEDATITGWTSIGEDLMDESAGVFKTMSGVNTKCHYTIDDGSSWTDYTVSVDIKSVDNDVSGVTFRVQDANNYYLFRQKFGDSGNWETEVQKFVGGVSSVLAGPTTNFGSGPGQVDDPATWYSYKVAVSGTNIKCYIDDVLVFDLNDSTYASGTAGLWLWAQTDAEFDNMLVE